MNYLAAGAAIVAALVGFFYARKGNAMEAPQSAVQPVTLDSLFKKYGAKYGVDWQLLKAIAMAESSLQPDAVRNNPPHDVSVGVMQILCLPGPSGYCSNRFNVDGWQGMTADKLLDPETNIAIGAQILAWNLRTYGNPRGIAVYNSYSARHAGPTGPFPNDSYVAKVLRNLAKLKGTA
jgi:soluble lytic murein transglycosylase-like protein